MLLEIFSTFINFLLDIISKSGYFGIFIGMAVESSFIPFPSEIILIPAGALIAMGEMSFLPVFIAGVLGSLLGALINYFIALFFGRITLDLLVARYGKFLLLDAKKLEKSDKFFEKHGDVTTFVGRLIPVVRQVISLPAGFAKMNILKFSLFTALGAGIWGFILISVGYFFGSDISSELKLMITSIVLAISIVIFLIYLRRRNHN
ncbi:MAG: DedA family protein [Nanoarchaeota archaeon]|nr:DedA family protein [Nanoarchaeota archaeon]